MSDLIQHILKVRESSRRIVRELGLLGNESPYDLPLSFRHVLIELDLRVQLTQLELTELLILDKSTVSRMVKKLINYKLVAATIDKLDKRYKLLTLTAAGKKVVNGIHQSAIVNVRRALKTVSIHDREQIERGLRLYAMALENARLGVATHE
ncbi:MAG: winged helix DNA-binding protein [Gammaproteobacteria bacterium]|nr:winged helix DNA-binding protein [Gammaproteobacteria bacterium]